MSRARYSEVVPSVTTVRLADGTRLHVKEYGDPAAALTVVLLHGWTLDSRLWRQQVADLYGRLAAQIRIVAFDLRGHGRSSPTARHTTTLVHLADDLAAVLAERVPTGGVVLAGHSMGGMAIMEYAHCHPTDFTARVRGAVFVATSAQGTQHTTYGLGPSLARLLRGLEMTGAAVLARSGPWRPHRPVMGVLGPGLRWLVFGHGADAAAISLTAEMIGAARLGAIGGFRPWIDEHDRVEALAMLAALPVAVLVGTRDRLTPQPCAETIARAVPGSDYIVCDGAGHMLPLERPDEVTDAIVRVCHRAMGIAPVRPRRRLLPRNPFSRRPAKPAAALPAASATAQPPTTAAPPGAEPPGQPPAVTGR